jgi:ABC-type multidrug transport system fused ATPase/permease subunit
MFSLVGTGLALAGLSVAGAYLMAHLLSGMNQNRVMTVGSLLIVAAAVGGGRVAERVMAEKLSQNYVQELRRDLMAAALAGGKNTSVGITIARITNDLSSVRNWVAMGIAPLAVGIPMITGTTIALWFFSPPLALAVALPLCILAAVLALLSRPAYARAKTLRSKRGRLAARVSDTLAAATTIRAAGGERREVQNIEQLGADVAAASIEKARVGGYIRASAGVTGTVTAVAVAATGSLLSIPTATIAAVLTVIGMLASHVHDLGRVAEYRQSFNTACRMLGPALLPAGPARSEGQEDQGAGARSTEQEPAKQEGDFLLHVPAFRMKGNRLPELNARPGERVILASAAPDQATEVFETLLALRSDAAAHTLVDGQDLSSAQGTQRRRLAGYAAKGAVIERGTIARAVRYRRPDLTPEMATEALSKVGLTARVAALPRAEHTVLKRGGEPLTMADRARLQLARAMLGEPPVLLLNHIDFDLGPDGRGMLAEVLRSYPGVAIIASEHPERLAARYTVWDLHKDAATGRASSD